MKSNALCGNWVVGAMTLVLAAMLAGPAQGQWLQNGLGPYLYTNGVNWTGGNINGMFPSSVTLTTNQTVTFDSNYSLQTGLSFLLNAGGAANRYNMVLIGAGANRTITLGGNLLIDPTNYSQWNLGFGSTTAGQNLNVALGGNRVFNSTLSRANGRGPVFINDISGPYSITKMGSGVIILESPVSFSGSLILQEGEWNLSVNGALTNIAGIALGGSTNLAANALLTLDNRQGGQLGGGNINVADRVRDGAVVNGVGNGRLGFRGYNGVVATETIGTFTLQAGLSQIYSVMSDNGAGTESMPTLTISSLSRSAGTVLMAQGGGQNALSTTYNNLGQGSGNGNARILATQINGAAPSGEMVNGIIPWMTVGPLASYAPSAFATYGANGFKPYGLDGAGAVNDNGGAEPYVTTIAAGAAASNVRITATEGVSGTKTINSLTLANALSVTNIGTGNTIVLASGGLLVSAASAIEPKIDFNGREGVVHANAMNLDIKGGFTNDGGNGITFFAGYNQGVGQGILLDAASSYTGPTRINRGVVTDRTVNGIPTNSALRIDAGGVLDLWDNASTTLGSLEGVGTVSGRNYNDVAMILVTGGNGASTTFDGPILNLTRVSGGTLGLTKVGGGTMTLGGRNSYLGSTVVSAGSLIVNGSIASTNITVAPEATFGGTGTVTGVTTVFTNGTLSAGLTNTAGTLTLASNLLLNAYSKLMCNINGSNDYDRIVVGGSTVSLNADSGAAGATLQLTLGYAPKAGQQFTILSSGTTISGSFANGSTIKASYGGGTYTFSISTSGGNIVLTTLTSGTMVYIR